jgi:N-acetylglucosamine-6-phosphate deacetylase
MPAPLLIARARPLGAADDADGGLLDVLVRDGRIAELRPAASAASRTAFAGRVLDAGGRTLIPGLIDVHVHGAGGGDLMDGTPAALARMARTLARLGTTSFLATGFALPESGNEHLRAAAALVAPAGGPVTGPLTGGARLLGIHLEGPFVNPVRMGGLPPECLWPPTPAAVAAVLEATAGALRMMTVAPELDGGLAAIRRLAAAGCIPSLGHSDATVAEARAGIAAGIAHATHLYNAMRPFHHREPGPLVALHEADGLTVQLVSDDVHVGRDAVAWTRRIFGHDRCICTTDGIRTTGLPDGRHTLAGQEYDSHNGVARYADGRLIGTSLSLLEIALRFREYTGCTLAEAIDTASLHPARLLGLDDRKGRIAPGYDADLVIMETNSREVWATVIGGEIVFTAG